MSDVDLPQGGTGRLEGNKKYWSTANAYRSEHRIDGAYAVINVESEILAAHSEWQDTAKLSALVQASKTKEQLSQITDKQDVECKCCPSCCGQFTCCAFDCCLWLGKCPACCCCCSSSEHADTLQPSIFKAFGKQAQSNKEVSEAEELERYLLKYEESHCPATTTHDSLPLEALEGTEATRKLMKRLHTIHLTFRAKSALWGEEIIESCVIIVDPYVHTVQDIVGFTSMIDLKLPTLPALKPEDFSKLKMGKKGQYSRDKPISVLAHPEASNQVVTSALAMTSPTQREEDNPDWANSCTYCICYSSCFLCTCWACLGLPYCYPIPCVGQKLPVPGVCPD